MRLEIEEARDPARRFSQLASPVAAKAVEDTAFYRYGRLLSRNDVGFSPEQFSLSPGEFLAKATDRGPGAMLATATHDHKRGEDVRARLAALSEIPDIWKAEVRAWRALNAPLRSPRLEAGDEYMLYQTLVGAWPINVDRVLGWREKSLREAKLETSWFTPDEAFERDNAAFVKAILDPAHGFVPRLGAFVERLTPAGICNSLIQCALRLTLPGIPDLYQGTELWDFSLVDPDNRRPVDYHARMALLDAQLELRDWRSGSPKLALIRHFLTLRRERPDIFEARTEHVPSSNGTLAFRRGPLLVAVPLLCARSCIERGMPLPAIEGTLMFDGRKLDCAELFADFPVALRLS
jgi:(1->4)-alpha-D-glucan 1-alpha-D-glucosylmutase